MGKTRENLVNRQQELWKPPPCVELGGVRRFFDLQAGTVWNDLAPLLSKTEGTLLDAGCGAQPYRPLLPPGVRYIGIDQRAAEADFGYKTPDTIYYSGDRWPVENGMADTVLSTETMEHLRDPRTFLAEAFRGAKAGGRLILTVPFSVRWHYIPHDYFRYTPSGLNMLLSESGFTNIEIYARGNPLTVASYKCMALALPFIMPQSGGVLKRLLLAQIGALMMPWFLFFAILGNISLAFGGGDDCLGYTALARKPKP